MRKLLFLACVLVVCLGIVSRASSGDARMTGDGMVTLEVDDYIVLFRLAQKQRDLCSALEHIGLEYTDGYYHAMIILNCQSAVNLIDGFSFPRTVIDPR